VTTKGLDRGAEDTRVVLSVSVAAAVMALFYSSFFFFGAL